MSLYFLRSHGLAPYGEADRGDASTTEPCVRETPTTLRREVNLVQASHHHALPWHKALPQESKISTGDKASRSDRKRPRHGGRIA
jgi:hypothetical protein